MAGREDDDDTNQPPAKIHLPADEGPQNGRTACLIVSLASDLPLPGGCFAALSTRLRFRDCYLPAF